MEDAQQRRLARLFPARTMPESVLTRERESSRPNAARGWLERARQSLTIALAIDVERIRRVSLEVLELLRQYVLNAVGIVDELWNNRDRAQQWLRVRYGVARSAAGRGAAAGRAVPVAVLQPRLQLAPARMAGAGS